MLWPVYAIHIATFDIQNPNAKEENGKINVAGEFIINSLAKGCFILIRCNLSTSDFFYSLKRQNMSERNVSEVIHVKSSIYTVYAYDLEEDAVPNAHPANSEVKTIKINSKCAISVILGISHESNHTDAPEKSESFTQESVLQNATISRAGLVVTVHCIFKVEHRPNASCVVVYREYTNTTLNVKVFTDEENSITLEETKPDSNYTFAVFGRRGEDEIDKVALTSTRMVVQETSKPSPPGKSFLYSVTPLVGVSIDIFNPL